MKIDGRNSHKLNVPQFPSLYIYIIWRARVISSYWYRVKFVQNIVQSQLLVLGSGPFFSFESQLSSKFPFRSDPPAANGGGRPCYYTPPPLPPPTLFTISITPTKTLLFFFLFPFLTTLQMDPSLLDDIINRLLEVRGRVGKQVLLNESEIRQLCQVSREIFLQQPNLLELEAPIKICGIFFFSPQRFTNWFYLFSWFLVFFSCLWISFLFPPMKLFLIQKRKRKKIFLQTCLKFLICCCSDFRNFLSCTFLNWIPFG